jgi:hypothetical protein
LPIKTIINAAVHMSISVIAPSSGGGRVTEIAVGVLFGIILVGAVCGICYYIHKRRIRARLEQKSTDIERRNRDGSVTTLADSCERDLSPEQDDIIDVNHGGRDGSIARQSHYQRRRLSTGKNRSADFSTYEAVHNTTSESVSQVSAPEIAHLESSRGSEPTDNLPHISPSPTEHR